MDLIAKGIAMVNSARNQQMVRAVIYQRGSDQVSVNATVGQSPFRLFTEFGSEYIRTRDYIITASLLVLSGQSIRPKAGDRIRESDGGKTFVYEVHGPGGESPVRDLGPDRSTLRIHTKLIAVE